MIKSHLLYRLSYRGSFLTGRGRLRLDLGPERNRGLYFHDEGTQPNPITFLA